MTAALVENNRRARSQVRAAERAWALRENATAYDASYIALAELLGTSLVTLDTRLARSSGARCPVLAPPAPTS